MRGALSSNRNWPKQLVTRGGARRSSALLGASALLVSLAGCGLFEEETGVEYTGIYDSEVHACAAIAMGGALRDDPRIPSSIWARNVDARLVSSSPDYRQINYLITGETRVEADGSAVYEWTCRVDADYDERTLNAILIEFQLSK